MFARAINQIVKGIQNAHLGFSNAYFIFVFFLFIYVFCGMFLTYPGMPDFNCILDADNERALGDLTLIDYNHYRIKVHPLFVILTQPVVLFLTGLTHNSLISVVIIEALCGSFGVTLLYLILEKMHIERLIKVSLTLLFGLSFSNILFSSIPETFIFAGATMILFLYCTACFLEMTTSSFREIVTLAACGVLLFGITITNYAFFLIGIIFLSFHKVGRGFRAFYVLKIVGLSLLAIVVLCVIQHLVWPKCPLFWNSIFSAINGSEQYEEMRYVHFALDPSLFLGWAKQFFVYPFISASPHQTVSSIGEPFIEFGYMPVQGKVFAFLFYGSFFVTCICACTQKRRNKATLLFNRTILFWVILSGFIFNFLLHLFYSPKAAFLYSPHYLFLLILLFAFALDRIKQSTVLKGVLFSLFICLFIQMQVNISSVNSLANLLTIITGLSCSIARSLGFAFCFTIVILVLLTIMQTASFGKESLKRWTITSYSVIVFLECFFIYIQQ